MNGLERATQTVQSLVQSIPRQQGTGSSGIGGHVESNSLVGKNLVLEGLRNKVAFKQRSRRDKLVAGAMDERFKALFTLAEAHDTNTQTVDHVVNGTSGAQKLSQHFYASLLTSAEAGANLSMMSNMLTPPKGKVGHIFFSGSEMGQMVRRQDESTGRQALSGDAKRTILLGMCRVEVEM